MYIYIVMYRFIYHYFYIALLNQNLESPNADVILIHVLRYGNNSLLHGGKVSRFVLPQVDAAEQGNRCESTASRSCKPRC